MKILFSQLRRKSASAILALVFLIPWVAACGTEVGNGNKPEEEDESNTSPATESASDASYSERSFASTVGLIFNNCTDVWAVQYGSTHTYTVRVNNVTTDQIVITQDGDLTIGTLNGGGEQFAYRGSDDLGGTYDQTAQTIDALTVSCTATQSQSLSEFAGTAGQFSKYTSELTDAENQLFQIEWVIQQNLTGLSDGRLIHIGISEGSEDSVLTWEE